MSRCCSARRPTSCRGPTRTRIANGLRKVLPERLAYAHHALEEHRACSSSSTAARGPSPRRSRSSCSVWSRKELGPDYDVETHFTPRYNPWDQRLCLVPDGDLFEAIRAGQASVVTDHIERFTETGIELAVGRASSTPTSSSPRPVCSSWCSASMALRRSTASRSTSPQTWTYKGMSTPDVPNLASTFGYINASWTLRADLTAEYVCRLLNHMDETGTRQCTPRLRPADARHAGAALDRRMFSSGYMQRVMHLLPQAGRPRAVAQPAELRRGQAAAPQRAHRGRRDAAQQPGPAAGGAEDRAPAGRTGSRSCSD